MSNEKKEAHAAIDHLAKAFVCQGLGTHLAANYAARVVNSALLNVARLTGELLPDS